MSEYKRLYRSRDNRMIGGVAGGLGEYLGIDPTIVRLLFVIFTFGVGSGVIAYLVMMLVVPEEPLGEE
jgi:phage shock protein C